VHHREIRTVEMNRGTSSSQSAWRRSGSEYDLAWAGGEWTLDLQGEFPGLLRPGVAGSILSLEGVASAGRSEVGVFRRGNLRDVELIRGRVQATYEPPGWGDLRVRAAWRPDEGGRYIDLEVQVTARSVDELASLEVLVASHFLGPVTPAGGLASWVRPRDAHSATLSYDGRVPVEELARLTTLAIPSARHPAFGPVQVRSPWSDLPGCLVEMVHPHDESRQIILGTTSTEPPANSAVAVRHALFGHDLEKGVALRGRLRAMWVAGLETGWDSMRAFREFVESPPPLGM
jgi:hypothetical protein